MKKLLSVIMCVVMAFGCLSVVAFAADDCVHDYQATVVPPTCALNGYTIHTCSKCGDYYYTDPVNALPHVYGNWTTVDVATCIAEGHEQRECINCGSKEIRTLPIISHVDKNADGFCDVCGQNTGVDKPFAPFDWFKAFFKAIADWFRAIFA